ncbi:MAG TPA: TolC family protein [Thermoanaerobaculia bacterium]|nr:TolC family protein [Thermoanaerobaculia bacterium]
MTAVRRWTSIFCLSLTATWLPAQTTTAPQTTTATTTVQRTTEPVTAETDRDITDPNALKLSLQDALGTAMQRNLGISLQSYDYQMAGESLRSQYGLYDWFGQGALSRAKVKGTSQSGALSETETDVANVGVAQNLPAGGNYFVGFNNNRQGGSFSPSLVFSATQPLMRNFGIDVTRRSILIARNTLGISREAFRLTLMDTAVTVEQAYYDLVYARRNVEVAKEALFLARDQARITQIRIDVGASAPLDILQPRVQISTTEEDLIRAVALVRSAEDRLRAVMNLASADWNRPIIPADSVTYAPVDINVEASVARAMDLRPELREALLATETRRVQYFYARNQVLPQVDLNLGYRALTGRTVAAFDPTGVPIFATPTYSQGLRQVRDLDFPAWSAGFTIGVPILNIGARAERRRAELDLDASKVSQEQTRQSIMVAVRSTARDVDTAARSIVASRTAREAAEQNLEAERRRYENGMTTLFQVLQIQQQLSGARVRELQALVGWAEALASYHRQVGDILDANNISLGEPPVAPEPRVFNLLDRYNWLNYDRSNSQK